MYASGRVPDQGRAKYGRGGRVRADDEVPRGTEDGEDGHREQQRVQAGHHRHPGDLRIPKGHRDAHRGQGDAGDHVRSDPGPVHGQQTAHHRQRFQPTQHQPTPPAQDSKAATRLMSAEDPVMPREPGQVVAGPFGDLFQIAL